MILLWLQNDNIAEFLNF